MRHFSSETLSLAQLFTSPISIEAPGYQRSFAWTPQEAGQLLEDIAQALGEDADYFLSFMLFIERSAPSSLIPAWVRARPERILEVVDGFQRLTSLTILFCVLRDLDAEQEQLPNARLLTAIGAGRSRGQPARLTLQPAENAFFDRYVRAAGATGRVPEGDLTPAQSAIIAARNHFAAQLADRSAPERARFVDFLLDHCRVALVVTGDIDRAHKLFTTLNARGKPLDRKDILKASLLGAVAPPAAAQAAAIWRDADARLGQEFEQLFSHIRSVHGRAGGQVISSVREIAAQAGGALPFLEQVLEPAATALADMRGGVHAGTAQSEAIVRTLGYLNRLGSSDWIPPAMLWWMSKRDDPEALAWLIGALDRLMMGMRLLMLGNGKRASWFGSVTTAIRKGHDLRAPDSVLNFSRQDLRTIQYNLRTLHARDASVAKYLLTRLSDHLAQAPQSLSWPAEMSIEHVLPRKLSPNSQWRGWFADPAERERCTESLGNLLLVTKAQNDRAGNHDFARKLDVYFRTPAAPVPAINEALRGAQEWKAAQIKARETELLRLVESLWSFGLKIDDDHSTQAAEPPPARRSA